MFLLYNGPKMGISFFVVPVGGLINYYIGGLRMSNAAQTSAMARIEALLDDNSFVEIGAMVTRRSTDFNLSQKEAPSDGVVTGYGVVNGNPVYVYSQDAQVLGGTIGEMHAKKIVNLYKLAMKTGAPVVGLVDCAGLRLEEASDGLAAFGEIYASQALASGVIPQITGVFGVCGGGVAVSAGMADFTFVEEKKASFFVNSPNTLDGNYKEKCNTGSAAFQMEAGTVDFSEEGEEAVIAKMRELISMLPSSNDEIVYDDCDDDLNRLTEGFDTEADDPAKALADISDGGVFVEAKKDFAREMVTGFIKLNGATVGAVANRKAVLDDDFKPAETFDGKLTADGCAKAADFVAFCDAFEIPVLTLTNVTGFAATVEEEKKAAPAAAKLTYAFANATVPKVNLITGKAYGSAYISMNSKHIGADLVFALPQAEIGMMDAQAAAKIICDDPAQVAETAQKYSELQSSAQAAAKRGYVDSIIDAASVRKHLIYAFEMLYTKSEDRPAKKHGTV